MIHDNSDTPLGKRPVLLSIFSGLSIIALSLGFIGSLFPTTISLLRTQFPMTYLLILWGLFPIGIIGSIGVWMMRRWGYYLYVAYTIFGYLLNFVFGVNAGIGAFLFSLAFLGVGLFYFKRMR